MIKMLMPTFIIAQLIGTIALLFSISIYQVNRRPTMLKLNIVAGLLYTIHFFLLGAITGSAMNLLSSLRSYAFFRFTPKGRIRFLLLIIFIILSIGATVLTWQGPLSLFALFGNLASTYASWHLKPKQIRRWNLVPPPFWFTYNAISHSYPGMLIEIINVVSNLVGEYRFDFKRTHHDRVRLSRPA